MILTLWALGHSNGFWLLKYQTDQRIPKGSIGFEKDSNYLSHRSTKGYQGFQKIPIVFWNNLKESKLIQKIPNKSLKC